MRKLARVRISATTQRFLEKRANQVKAALNPKTEARRLWALQKNKAFQEIRRKLLEMAFGINRCMYCEDSKGTDIDHFEPKALRPTRAFEWENYLLACSECNSNCKRSQFPTDPVFHRPLLIDPTVDDPKDHLAFSPLTGYYDPITPKGEKTRDVFNLNGRGLPGARLRAWSAAKALVREYAHRKDTGDLALAEEARQGLTNYPLAGVLSALLDYAQLPGGHRHVDTECRNAIQGHPEISTWV